MNSPRLVECGVAHRFPSDPKRRNEWIIAVKRDQWQSRNHSVVCGRHFKSDDYEINNIYNGKVCSRPRIEHDFNFVIYEVAEGTYVQNTK